ncbi:RNA-directed DNA polymerase from transposon x-element-like protein-related [Anaeramoeba flamelloides]|uniref:RNA-directed DNA polymerase from transposon x-element-like protein-related n=1 Tax=Anaeramoeba flamelloides TaxID=1746091 RepID=A0AAV7Z1V3_9EUKA|nr:RNA-directed DNA polymerase from transposon x-element-like protein-related [Anaeramoeba flamelloides]
MTWCPHGITSKPFFSVEEIKEQIQWIKNKSTKYFDKLKLYKQEQTQNQQNQNETYNQFIASIQTVFNNWIKNPNNSTINFIKERDLLFIHKKGDEGLTLNYRPISINSSLARIFLKLLYKKIEKTWVNIDPKQFGFRTKFDTRIAVKNFLYNYQKEKKKNKNCWAITIDLAKCFNSIPHKLIVKTISKFIDDKLIVNFLQSYYAGDGRGVYQGDPLSPIIFCLYYSFHFRKNQTSYKSCPNVCR